jgi:hypothetical protein
MIKLFRNIHYRNGILPLQNQIAVYENNKIYNKDYDKVL